MITATLHRDVLRPEASMKKIAIGEFALSNFSTYISATKPHILDMMPNQLLSPGPN